MLTFATLDGQEPSDDRLSTKISEAHNSRINKHPLACYEMFVDQISGLC